MKKPKKSGSEYYNYKGFFFLVLLALIDTEYRFFWIDVGSSGSSSDAQIFNCSKSRKKIVDGTLGFHHLNPWGREDQICTILLGDNAFALMPWVVISNSRVQLKREEKMAHYRVSRGRRVVENAFGK